MSIKIMTLVWSLDMPATHKIVLLALADNANDEGDCYPSVATLVAKCGISERSIHRVIAKHQEDGHLHCHYRTGRSTIYKLHPRHSGTPVTVAPPSQWHPTPAALAPPPPQPWHPGGATVAPITVIEPSIESSSNHKSTARSFQSDQDNFQHLKTSYPKFAGRQDWIQAEKYCSNRIDDGETWLSLKAAVDRFAAYCRSTDREGTNFVMSPGKFFSAADEPWKQPWDPPVKKLNGTRQLDQPRKAREFGT